MHYEYDGALYGATNVVLKPYIYCLNPYNEYLCMLYI
jgi:hypothetical protein